MWLYIVLTKSFLVYLSDLYTAMTMLTTKGWSNGIFQKCKESGIVDNCVVVDFTVGKWIFVGCIIFGYLLVCVFFFTSRFMADACFSCYTNRIRPTSSFLAGTFRMSSTTSWRIRITVCVRSISLYS